MSSNYENELIKDYSLGNLNNKQSITAEGFYRHHGDRGDNKRRPYKVQDSV